MVEARMSAAEIGEAQRLSSSWKNGQILARPGSDTAIRQAQADAAASRAAEAQQQQALRDLMLLRAMALGGGGTGAQAEQAAILGYLAPGSQRSADESKYRYRSSSGARYQYDLSNPGDQIRYEVDVGAQLRDSVSPRRELDVGLGQHGGGIEP